MANSIPHNLVSTPFIRVSQVMLHFNAQKVVVMINVKSVLLSCAGRGFCSAKDMAMRYNCYRVLFRPAYLVQSRACDYACSPLLLILHFPIACSEGREDIITLHQSANLKLLKL